MKSFISHEGIEVNNPNICIKGKSTFACVCTECIEQRMAKMSLIVAMHFGNGIENKCFEEGKEYAKEQFRKMSWIKRLLYK